MISKTRTIWTLVLFGGFALGVAACDSKSEAPPAAAAEPQRDTSAEYGSEDNPLIPMEERLKSHAKCKQHCTLNGLTMMNFMKDLSCECA